MRRAAAAGGAILVFAVGLWAITRDDGTAARRGGRVAEFGNTEAHTKPAEPAPQSKVKKRAQMDQKPEARTTTFHVLAAGKPLAEAEVLLADHDVRGVTDSDGAVALVHPRESPRYVVRKVGFQTAFGNTGRRESCQVALKAGKSARGRVLDAATGRPVAGASVRVRTNDKRPQPLDVIQSTDREGWYRVAGLGEGWPIRIAASAPGYAPVEVLATGRPLLDLVLGDGGGIHGEVKDADGQRLAGVEVVIPHSGVAWLISREAWERTDGVTVTLDLFMVAHAVTDEAGRYHVRGLEFPAEYNLVAFRRGSGRAVRQNVGLVRSQRTRREDLRIEPASSLTLVLVDEAGQSVPTMSLDALIIRKERDERQIAEGRQSEDGSAWHYNKLIPGRHAIQISADNHVPKTIDVTLGPGEHRDLRVTLESGLAIGGVLVDGEGQPVSGMHVEFISRGMAPAFGWERGEALTDKGGAFRIAGLGDCAGTLTVHEPRDRLEAQRAGVEGKYAPIAMEGFRTGKSDLRIVARRAARVVFATEPSPLRLDVSAAHTVDVPLVRDGERYEIRRLPLGEPLRLYLRPRGFAVEARNLEPLGEGETRDLGTIKFDHGLTLVGVVRDRSGEPIQGASVSSAGGWSRESVTTDAGGNFQLRNLVPGKLTVCASAEGYVGAIVGIPEGGHDELVVVTLSAGGVISGRVLDSSGEPAIDKNLSIYVVPAHDPVLASGESADVNDRAEYRRRVAAGSYILIVEMWEDEESRELQRVTFAIRDGETTKLDVRLK